MKDKIRCNESFKLKVMEELRDAKRKSVKEAATAYGGMSPNRQMTMNIIAT